MCYEVFDIIDFGEVSIVAVWPSPFLIGGSCSRCLSVHLAKMVRSRRKR